MEKRYIRLSALAAVALAAASCIYDYEADIESTDEEKLMVIEGDIIPGDYTEISLGYVFPLSASTADMTETPIGYAWVEDDQGVTYTDPSTTSYLASEFTINTTAAPSDRKYRLLVDVDNKSYYTDWLTPNPAPVLDSLSYSIDDANMVISLSAHSDDGGEYFRWNYEELWKYHAEYVAEYYFDEETETEVLTDPDYTYYWCWNDDSSSEVELCATSDLNTNAIVNHEFLSVSRSSRKMMIRYRITVKVRSISADAYRFLHTLEVNSDFVGSLFSPTPSDVRGNVFCSEDPDEYVVGYVDCCEPSASSVMYVDTERYYIYPGARSTPFVPEIIYDEDGNVETGLSDYWRQGYTPIYYGTDYNGTDGVLWDLKRCIDCRLDGGGTIEEPEDWID